MTILDSQGTVIGLDHFLIKHAVTAITIQSGATLSLNQMNNSALSETFSTNKKK